MPKSIQSTKKAQVEVSSNWYPSIMKAVKLIASLGVSFSAALVGTLATTPNIPTWYTDLEKPFFNPPNWVFGPVWTILYVLIGISLYLLWTHQTEKPKTHIYLIFIGQIWLNALWSLVFFGLHLPWGYTLIAAKHIVVNESLLAVQQISCLLANTVSNLGIICYSFEPSYRVT